VGSMVTWALAKQTCGSLRNFVMLVSFDFMTPNQISNMSLNDLRRRVANHDKTQIETGMDEVLVALDLRH
jgi:hypothetical protein